MNSGGQTIAYLTVAGSHATAAQSECSIYTSDTATFADGVGVCNPLLRGFGLATLPPS